MLYEPRHTFDKPTGRLNYFLCAILIFVADQVSKNAIVSSMRLESSIPLIPGFFHLTFIMNSGGSFGFLKDRISVFITINIVVLIVIFRLVFYSRSINNLVKTLLGVITGGALGNLSDRIQYGAVVDFLDFRGIWRYIFNVADMAVVCGSIALALVFLFDAWMPGKGSPKHLNTK